MTEPPTKPDEALDPDESLDDDAPTHGVPEVLERQARQLPARIALDRDDDEDLPLPQDDEPNDVEAWRPVDDLAEADAPPPPPDEDKEEPHHWDTIIDSDQPDIPVDLSDEPDADDPTREPWGPLPPRPAKPSPRRPRTPPPSPATAVLTTEQLAALPGRPIRLLPWRGVLELAGRELPYVADVTRADSLLLVLEWDDEGALLDREAARITLPIENGCLRPTLRLRGEDLQLSLRLSTDGQAPRVVLGRDVLAERFVVDPKG